MKACQIFKTKRAYKITTMYRLESWSYIESKPINILPIKSSLEMVSKVVFESLESSRVISDTEEEDFWLGNQLLKELKEKSYDSLYKKSTSCMIFVKDNEFIIEPQVYKGRGLGLEVDESRVLKLEANLDKLLLIEEALNLLT